MAINDRLLAICRLIILCGTIELTCGKGLHSARLEVRCTLFFRHLTHHIKLRCGCKLGILLSKSKLTFLSSHLFLVMLISVRLLSDSERAFVVRRLNSVLLA